MSRQPARHVSNRWLAVLLTGMLILLAWSGWRPKDNFTWLLETLPVMVAVPVLWFTRRLWPLTPLLYGLIALHGALLMLGGHYTYAEVPLGEWMRDAFGWQRNHYDRIGHFAQGFVPALIAREVLRRHLPAGVLLSFLCLSVAMCISAVYELLEMAVAVISGTAATAFLGTQGDIWDTQMDMLLALLGALCALLSLSRWQDRQLAGSGIKGAARIG